MRGLSGAGVVAFAGLSAAGAAASIKPIRLSKLALNPLCQAPGGNYEMVQSFAKAYPSLRLLQVLRGVGDNAVVASVCARNVGDESSPDYGYRPAVSALVESVRPALQ